MSELGPEFLEAIRTSPTEVLIEVVSTYLGSATGEIVFSAQLAALRTELDRRVLDLVYRSLTRLARRRRTIP
jgi:hypothetical protein